MKINKSIFIAIIVLLVLCIDQSLKIYIKTNFYLQQKESLFGLNWAYLNFIENPGMAFGIELGGKGGKYALSIFRILAVFFIIYIIRGLIKSKASYGLLACFGLILAGAIGNILDSMFYGLIFSVSSPHGAVAEFLPEGGGYAPFLQGKVVDMLYFPLVDTHLPDWLGGGRFRFFRPIFNIADAAISTGVISLLLFYRKFFLSSDEEKSKEETETTSELFSEV
ncbi:MAG: lipoprotein signal peptidase, partial [Bacteroidota bacterium]